MKYKKIRKHNSFYLRHLILIMLFAFFSKTYANTTKIVIIMGYFNDVAGDSAEPQLYIVPSKDIISDWGINLLKNKNKWAYSVDPGGTAITIDFNPVPNKAYHIKIVDGYGDQGIAENVILSNTHRIHFRHDMIRQNYTAYSPGIYEWDNNRLGLSYDISKDNIKPLHSKREIHDRYLSLSFLCNRYDDTHGQNSSGIDFSKKMYQLDSELTKFGLETLNFARWLVGLNNPITINNDLQTKAQMVAVLIAKNHGFRNLVRYDLPEDFFNKTMSFVNNCLTASHCGNDNLFESVSSWLSGLKDKLSVKSRRYLLSPYLGQIGFGFADEDYSVAYISDLDKSAKFEDKAQAWPPPGFFPIDFSLSVWSISLNPKYFQEPKLENVQVKLTRLYNNKIWILDKNNYTSNPSTCGPSQSFFNVDNQNYGTNNAIIFKPDSKSSNFIDGEVYKVEISGIKDNKGKS
ncbi:MAG: hypothetical protein JXR58_09210, partial [Bacteroidales bacterium]|nr:hypothetical protein [Bacteroidales bacterium]